MIVELQKMVFLLLMFHLSLIQCENPRKRPALLISGGQDGNGPLSSVEAFVPGLNKSCFLPSLPVQTEGHTQDQLTMCGGLNSEQACYTFTEGSWVKTASLREERRGHSSWRSEGGLVLIGGEGEDSERSTEVITDSGLSKPGFELRRREENIRRACTIASKDHVVITGGWPGIRRVVAYDMREHLHSYQIPPLKMGRYDHACGGYLTDTGETISVVVGGLDKMGEVVDSSEMHTTADDYKWELLPSPLPVQGLRGATVANIFYVTGGLSGHDEIFKLDPSSLTWTQEGRMKEARSGHSVSEVDFADIEQYCTDNRKVDGSWGSWADWASCSRTCGGGTATRQRFCNSPSVAYGGRDCEGDDSEKRQCNTHHCPVDGSWGSWGYWASCSRTCGGGTQSRRRLCNSPSKAYGGRYCSGDSSQQRQCNTHRCPVDGSWSSWGYWSQCDEECDGGKKTRWRSCDRPAPAHGGTYCYGDNSEKKWCNTHDCPTYFYVETPIGSLDIEIPNFFG